MKSIFSFRHDREEKITKSALDLKKFIDSYTENKIFSFLYKYFRFFYGLPFEISKHELRHFLGTTFEFQDAKFSEKFSITKLPKYVIKYLGFVVYIFIYSRPYLRNDKVDLLLIGAENEFQVDRFDNLLRLFDKDSVAVAARFNAKSLNYISSSFPGYKNRSRKSSLLILMKEIFVGLPLCLTASLYSGVNLLPFSLFILNRYSLYQSILSRFSPNYTIQERHYETSAILSFLVKKNGGVGTTSIQKNIIQIGFPCYYHYVDTLFSLGSLTYEEAFDFGAKVNRVVPVGSFFMEKYWFGEEQVCDDPELVDYDVICLGGNSNPDFTTFLNTYEGYWDDYYEHFQWHVRLAAERPDLKIAIKHHSNNSGDPYEDKVISGTSVKYAERSLNSYLVADKAKCITTWCSTMGYEFLGHGKPVIFPDPGKRNVSFLPEREFLDKWRATSYKEFKKLVLEIIDNQKNVGESDRQKYCYESQNVSKNIKENLGLSGNVNE